MNAKGMHDARVFLPNYLFLDDQGYIATDGFDVPPGKEEIVRAAAQACPERVITILDDGPSEKD